MAENDTMSTLLLLLCYQRKTKCFRVDCEYPPCVSDLAAVVNSYIPLFINGQLTLTELFTLCR